MDYEWCEREKGKEDLFLLYQALGWQQFLKLEPSTLNQAMTNSWFVLCCAKRD